MVPATGVGAVTPDEVVALREVALRFEATLSDHFASEAGQGEIDLPEGPDSPLIGRTRRWDEARLTEVALVDQPADGLLVSVQHWSVPRGTTLDVFVPAYGDFGVLTDRFVIPMLPMIHLREQLESRGFAAYWTTGPDQHLLVSLYDAMFPSHQHPHQARGQATHLDLR